MRNVLSVTSLPYICLLVAVGCGVTVSGNDKGLVGSAPVNGQDSNRAALGNMPVALTPTVGSSGNVVLPSGDQPAGSGNDVGASPLPGSDVLTTPAQVAAARFIGRIAPQAPVMSWSGSAVEMKFEGTSGVASFTAMHGANELDVAVDGNSTGRVTLNQSGNVTVGPLRQGVHTVRLTKLNEAELGFATFAGFNVDGNVLAADVPVRRMTFIGGSMTLGYGVEGTDPCSNSARLENALLAYSGATAAAFGADAQIVAWSGRGLLRNGVGVTDTATMPDIYRRAVAGDSASVYDFAATPKPQVVVTNFGTNDFATGGGRAALDIGQFTAKYQAFVLGVRQQYPDAFIVLTGSPMLSQKGDNQHASLLNAITTVRDQLADSKVSVLDFPPLSGTTGCNSHPSKAQQKMMAQLLQAELTRVLGWQAKL